ncbi:TIGR03943 family putative permease subunit [Microbacterium gilvum]|uniref:TIGR03943 family protein n=1 Tax=Microbacterium gilvum TaxID=1336204 RepID=A0ABP9A102_9MICO
MAALGTRWLGAGLASLLAVVTIGLALTGRLQLYINPAQAWFTVGMAVLVLAGAVWSFSLPLGAESEHGHDHGADLAHDVDADHGAAHRPRRMARGASAAFVAVGGVAASAVAVAALVLPPASLSVELAMDRDTGTPPLFAGADEVVLGAADTSAFGVGEWSSVFATATNPDAYTGQEITLTGYVAPADGSDGGLRLGRLVITHCVIDAQPASIPVSVAADAAGDYPVGEWIEVQGVVTADAAGALAIQPETITVVEEPEDPYEY